jgi:hypothetical protein
MFYWVIPVSILVHEGSAPARHVAQLDQQYGGINDPARLAVLERKGSNVSARLLDNQELAEHRNSKEAAEAHLGLFREMLTGKTVPERGADELPSAPAAG